MKNISTKTFILIFIFGISLTSLTSCKKEGCTDENAENYDSKAKEDDDSCTYVSDKFVGVYAVTELCGESTKTYGLTINQSSDNKADISLFNLNDLFGPLVSFSADVEGNSISFHKNILGTVFSGDGTLSGNTLTIDYSINDFGTVDQCVATCVK